MGNGFFMTVEGGEGAGKTTLIVRLAEWLAEQGYEVVMTREPGGIPIAESIRAIILDKANTAMDPRTEALLYAAARRQHLAEKVLPGLERGAVVLCDRFVDSSLAYQGYARGLGIDAVWDINRFAVAGTMPNLTLYMDINPEIGLRRIQAANEREINRLDLESITFHRLVREGYKLLPQRFPGRIVEIDADSDEDTVLRQAIQETSSAIKGFSHLNVK
ncbi:thymidylate kinase [Paenibacillus darwinianus]|uniref:Thymidylate kinase n=1 Tax=Paenibacillus darwinianus TaxID=1380763 RepID=A0A9W5W6Z4_9BACL|nr:dTMP kinase [Paenibacillus darwinianus]EXX86139.1 thymidylate kinase [Paenibacillus darwinianus]EXX86353.1 thymidylate kinase [Paenibacillus darwinianus]EXX88531.1 thymidylate kinase [Paenibacillus darwinianus]